MTSTALDTFIRALAAHDSKGPTGFVGKGKLVKLVAAEIPEEGFPGVWGSKSDILQRLDELLATGLASELNERATLTRCTLDVLAQNRIQYEKQDGTVSSFEFFLGTSPATNIWPVSEAAPPQRLSTTEKLFQLLDSARAGAAVPRRRRKSPASRRQSESSTNSRPAISSTPSSSPREPPATQRKIAATPDSTMNLPYSIQHAILPRLQTALEQSCFNFLMKYAPHILEAKGWVIYEAAELTHYTREIIASWASGQAQLLAAQFAAAPDLCIAALKQLDEIRHKAVHREPVTTEKLFQLLDSARAGAAVLRDDAVGELVDVLRRLVDTDLAPMDEKRDRAVRSLEERKRKIKSRLEDLEAEKRLLEREALQLDVDFQEIINSINSLVANVGKLYDNWEPMRSFSVTQ